MTGLNQVLTAGIGLVQSFMICMFLMWLAGLTVVISWGIMARKILVICAVIFAAVCYLISNTLI